MKAKHDLIDSGFIKVWTEKVNGPPVSHYKILIDVSGKSHFGTDQKGTYKVPKGKALNPKNGQSSYTRDYSKKYTVENGGQTAIDPFTRICQEYNRDYGIQPNKTVKDYIRQYKNTPSWNTMLDGETSAEYNERCEVMKEFEEQNKKKPKWGRGY